MDIVIEGTIGNQSVVVSVECRDRARSADVTWVEQMQSKHARLPTNVLVLCSHSAFTEEAERVAALYGIRCCQFIDVAPDEPDRLFPDASALWAKACQASVQMVRITVEAVGQLSEDSIRAAPDTTVFLDDGRMLTSAAGIAHALINSEHIMRKVLADAKPEHQYLECSWERPRTEGKRLCLEKVQPKLLRPIKIITIGASCKITNEEFPLRHGRYGAVRVAWGSVSLLGSPMEIIATADADAVAPRLSVAPAPDK